MMTRSKRSGSPASSHRFLEPGPSTSSWEGRAFGGIVLAAFLLYGIGSVSADRPAGMALVVVNSIAVAGAGLIGLRLLRRSDASIGVGYFVARILEGVLLVGGIALAEYRGIEDADTTGRCNVRRS